MLVKVEQVLTQAEIEHIRGVLSAAEWIDGKVTAGAQSALAKNNLQVPEDSPQARALGEIILRALGRSPLFNSAALPFRVFPPLFNRYDEGMRFGAHVDNAIRHVPGAGVRIRTDVSATLFLTAPEDYDGGELMIQDHYGEQRVKFAAGDMALYPADSLHHVTPVTRGSRWAAFFWIQSMIRNDTNRNLLFQMDRAIGEVRAELGDSHSASVSLTACYHNLLRAWAEM